MNKRGLSHFAGERRCIFLARPTAHSEVSLPLPPCCILASLKKNKISLHLEDPSLTTQILDARRLLPPIPPRILTPRLATHLPALHPGLTYTGIPHARTQDHHRQRIPPDALIHILHDAAVELCFAD